MITAGVAIVFALTSVASPQQSALLFFDGTRLKASSNLVFRIGSAHLASVYRDPSSFVGWGYPSVWRLPSVNGTSTYRMLYQGWHLRDGKMDTKLMLLASSADGILWQPTDVRGADGRGQCGDAWNHVVNCVANDGGSEFSVVYDDGDAVPPPPSSERLKLLWGNGTISVGGVNGTSWRPNWNNWTSRSIDPGISVFRNPYNPAELVVTARPQSLRQQDGRHAGFHSGGDAGWAGLGTLLNERALPLDLLNARTDEAYGLPSFSYAGMVISYYWRYACPSYPCYSGGNVSAALAFSYNARNWTAFGQFQLNTAVMSHTHLPAAPPPPVVPRGPIANVDLGAGGPAYNHTYRVFANKTEGACACQAECDADVRCKAFTYVIGNTCCGVERCCRFARLGCPAVKIGCVSGFKTPSPCVTPTPAPSPAPVRLPELFPNVPGSLYSGQIYPNTLVASLDDTGVGDHGTILIHASASNHEHGFVSSDPGTWSSILTFMLRKDGFAYVTPDLHPSAVRDLGNHTEAEATMVTLPLGWSKGELLMNADCALPGAAVRVGVLYVNGTEISGYGVSDAKPFSKSNKTSAVASWSSGRTMAALSGTNVSLLVILTGPAKLYSLRGSFVHLH